MTADQVYEERIGPARKVEYRPRDHRGAFIALGVLSVIAGLLAFVFPLAATLAAALMFGAILVAVGLAQIANGIRTRGWKGWIWMVIAGVLSVAVGILLFARPIAGVLTLTMLLGAFFLVEGVVRTVMAFGIRSQPGWGLLLANGILGILLGILVFTQWPQAAAWLLGIVLGVDLILNGIWLISASSGVTRHVVVRENRASVR